MTTPRRVVVPKVRVHDHTYRRVHYDLDPEVERDTLMTSGRHSVEFDPTRLVIVYDQRDLVATEGEWAISVEVSGPRVLRDGTHGTQTRSRTFHDGDDWPTYVQTLVAVYHPDNPAPAIATPRVVSG